MKQKMKRIKMFNIGQKWAIILRKVVFWKSSSFEKIQIHFENFL